MKTYSTPEHIPIPIITDYFYGGGFDIESYDRDEQEYLTLVSAWVKENTEPHKLSGEVVRKPYADGYAVYLIAKVDGVVGLMPIPLGDAWRDAAFERTATVDELARLVDDARRFAKFWATTS